MIRYAAAGDHAAISELVAQAFGRPDEARLVEGLRTDEDAMFELVAEESGEFVGHIMFSRLWADRDELYAALAPLAVRPEHQRKGLGAALVRAGLERAPQFGAFGVLVLGDPAYYGRFGFTAATAAQVHGPWRGQPAFMALALGEGAFDRPMSIAYPNAFGA
ncbi:MAG TPA: N-acetyltransferase [Phenylobacterium sp.]|uniref:GNAT family N-acetyltransferase n=1 Tax=Phenylobacterium sp. TaxID=1871053 RepID=UPI002C3DD97D|nr:N-acetyltransferase [Phenylobacterium sp.]HSV04000.1 N-acetyltransferase [Phenylobacterium sp.]